MTPLETLKSAAEKLNKVGPVGWLTPHEAWRALVAAGHLPAPDVTIQVTLTPEEADAFADEYRLARMELYEPYARMRACCKVRDAIFETRGAQ